MRSPCSLRIREAGLVALVVCLALPQAGWGQGAGYKRRSANGREFPSWEQEVATSIPPPLPTARQGRHVLELSIVLEAPATGVVRTRDRALVAPLVDGRVVVTDLGGELQHVVPLAEAEPWAPVAAGALAVVAAGRALAGIGSGGEAWRVELPAELAWRPSVSPSGLFVTLTDGRALRLDPADGRVIWTAAPEAGLSCGPAETGPYLAWGTSDGRLLARRTADGERVWEDKVADVVSSVVGDDDSVYYVARGRTGRSKRAVGPYIGRLSHGGKAEPEVKWRARVGGLAQAEPVLLGPLVAFPCFDGYVHAVRREDGGLQWRTDLPARVTEQPVLMGGRLDVLMPLSRWAVAVAADNGAVMGWMELPDEDESFVGPAAVAGGYTIAATSFGRLVGLRWEYEDAEGEGG